MTDVSLSRAVEVRTSLPSEVSVNCYRPFAVFVRSHLPWRARAQRLTVRPSGIQCWIAGPNVLEPMDCWLVPDSDWRPIGEFIFRVSGVAPPGKGHIDVTLDLYPEKRQLPLMVTEQLGFEIVDMRGCVG